ncbi:MAG: type IV toxin-antitoxin system AbiEi family antitoxin domain-containing protein [Acidimicrobiales bacterium]|nr:type IV toxin-antitoxin system AbiEi family antitoxin domain-containing protein [Acidimicrobiales bacterium]
MSYTVVVPAHPTLARLAPIAEDQWGLVTRRQAEDSGVSKATLTRLIGNGVLERVAHGVYRLRGVPPVDHLDLRAAWLQLAPEIPVWERSVEQGVVSHRSAAALYGLGDLSADRHEFILPARKQSRRRDVRPHVGKLTDADWSALRGLPVTRPSRIAADLLAEREDLEAVGRVVTDAIRGGFDYPATFAETLASVAAQLGLRRGDGLGALRWLLDLSGDRHAQEWLGDAQASIAHAAAKRDS